MKDVYKLYIDNKLVDLPQDIEFPMNYCIDDLANPSAVKNEFSKSLTIDGTDNNNKIFGEIYNFDREQLYSINSFSGVHFNPTKRTPFSLYRNGDINQSGYIQLNDITINNKLVKYTFTLFGGLGDFFYSLMYDNEGNKLTLADLQYNIEDDNGNVLPSDKEMDIIINKELVNKCFDNAGLDGNKFENVISFIPSYNGNYDDFDTNTVLVNTYNSKAFPITSVTDNGVTYRPYEGYVLAKSDNDYNEWEVRDLRSYMQRPAIRMKKIIEAISNPINNGGYDVELDETFFNDGNPYYAKSYIALPLLSSLKDSKETDIKTSSLVIDESNAWLGGKNGVYQAQRGVAINLSGDINTTEYNGQTIIDVSNIEVDAKLNLELAFSLEFTPETNAPLNNTDELYLSYWRQFVSGNVPYNIVNDAHYKSFLIQAYLQDADTNEYLWYSDILNFSNSLTINKVTTFSDAKYWINYLPMNGTMKRMNGRFVKSGNKYVFKLYDGNHSTFQVFIDNAPRRNKMKLSYLVKLVSSDKINIDNVADLVTDDYTNVFNNIDYNTKATYNNNVYITKGYYLNPINSASKFEAIRDEVSLKSGTEFTKKEILKTEFSPADILLDYTKLFGLMYLKNVNDKTIKIMSKNTYYTDNIIDLNTKIDWSKELKITPTLIETKYLTMAYDKGNTQYIEKYKTDYNVDFGQKRIDTNYNFNVESKNMYDGTSFGNAVTILDTSSYYRRFKKKNSNVEVPVWVLDNPKISLYETNANPTAPNPSDEPTTAPNPSDEPTIAPNPSDEPMEMAIASSDGDTLNSIEIDSYNASIVNLNSLTSYNSIDGYDVFPKLCCFKQDSNGKALEDITATLVFFNGMVETKDSNGNELPYWLSDDTYQMITLNDGVCYLYTEQEQDYNLNNIAIKRTTLPQFTRYCYNNNVITDSLDFGQPKENYIPNLYYDESTTIYERFWKNYLFDKYNVNTKLVSCYVNLTDMNVNNEFSRNLFYFNNSYWVIHSIESYWPNNYQTTKVDFVKVNDMTNYSNGQMDFFYPNVQLSTNKLNIEYNTTAYTITVTSSNDWQAEVIGWDGSLTPSTGEAGTTEVKLLFDVNNTYNEKIYKFKFYIEGYGEKYLTVTQPPNPNTTFVLSGYVYNKKNATPIVNAKVQVGDVVAYTDSNGFYKMYLQKGGMYDIEVYINDEIVSIQFISETQNNLERNFEIKL